MKTPELFKDDSRLKYLLISIASLILLLIISFVYYLVEQNKILKDKHEDLSVIANLKYDQIIDWKYERLYEAELFSGIDRIKKSALTLINNSSDRSSKDYLNHLFNSTILKHDYENVFLTDLDGKILYSNDTTFKSADSITIKFIKKSNIIDSLLFIDFNFCTIHNKIHLDIISLIKDYTNNHIAALVFRINPVDNLFPMMHRWPNNSKTAETILIRKEASQLRVISPLKHKDITPLSLTIPLTRKEFVGVKGLSGQTGIIEGKDYRMEDVLADLKAIPGTEWYLISKIDKSEILSELPLRTGTIILIGSVLFVLIIVSIFFIYKMRQSAMFKELFIKETELNEFQIKYKTITDSAKDAIILIDGDGKISFWNPAAEAIFGYSIKEVIGVNLHKLLAPAEYQPQYSEAFKIFKHSGKGNAIGKTLELTAITKNQTEIFIELGLSSIKYNDEWQAVGIVRDITERKLTEQRLFENEEKFRKAFDTSADLMAISRLSDGYLLDVNNGFCRVTGFSKEEISGKSICDLNLWIDENERENQITKIMRDGSIENEEIVLRIKDGSFLYGLLSASLTNINDEPYMICMVRDITERKKIEKSLKESEELFRHSFNYSASGMCIISLDGKFQKINDSFTKILGYNKDEISGYHFNDITHPEDVNEGGSRFDLMLKGVFKFAEFEKRYLTKENKIVWCHISTSLVRDSNDRPQFFITQLIDISERKEIENALKQSEENYRHIFNGMNDMVFVSDLHGQFIHVNDAVSEKLGYSKEELVKMSPFDIDAGLEKEQITDLIQNLTYDKILNFETYHRSKSGTLFPVEIRTTIINFQGKKVILDIARDISERKEIENALKQSEENYRHIFNGMNDMVFVIDLNGKFLEVNNSASMILGYSKEELLQLGPADIDNNFNKDDIKSLIERIPSDQIQSFETSHLTKAGITIPVQIKSTIIPYKGNNVILSIVRDISESKEAHRRILESEEKFRTMITQMQLGVAVHEIICDQHNIPIDYRFLDINESFERLMGLKKENIIGKRVLEIIPELESNWIEKYGYVALTGEPLQFEDYAKELGKYFSVVAYRPKPMQFAVIVEDITDRKNAESELVERMTEITRFNNLMIGREEKMIELKNEINMLLEASGLEKKYTIVE